MLCRVHDCTWYLLLSFPAHSGPLHDHLLLNLSAMHGKHPSIIIMYLIMFDQYQTKPIFQRQPVKHLKMKIKMKTMAVSLALMLVHFINYLTSVLSDIYLPLTYSQRSASHGPASAVNEGMYSLPDYLI